MIWTAWRAAAAAAAGVAAGVAGAAGLAAARRRARYKAMRAREAELNAAGRPYKLYEARDGDVMVSSGSVRAGALVLMPCKWHAASEGETLDVVAYKQWGDSPDGAQFLFELNRDTLRDRRAPLRAGQTVAVPDTAQAPSKTRDTKRRETIIGGGLSYLGADREGNR